MDGYGGWIYGTRTSLTDVRDSDGQRTGMGWDLKCALHAGNAPLPRVRKGARGGDGAVNGVHPGTSGGVGQRGGGKEDTPGNR